MINLPCETKNKSSKYSYQLSHRDTHSYFIENLELVFWWNIRRFVHLYSMRVFSCYFGISPRWKWKSFGVVDAGVCMWFQIRAIRIFEICLELSPTSHRGHLWRWTRCTIFQYISSDNQRCFQFRNCLKANHWIFESTLAIRLDLSVEQFKERNRENRWVKYREAFRALQVFKKGFRLRCPSFCILS